MSESAGETNINAVLREMAETRLRTGTANIAASHSLGMDALNLLYKLSSNPDTAGDALKLLHELQVHQVEIDLQNEAMQNDEHRLVSELDYYRALYENAPIGYLVVDLQGTILKINQAGARLFDATPGALRETHISHLVSPDSGNRLKAVLESLAQGGPAQATEVIMIGDRSRPLRVMANLSPDQLCALLVCCDVP